MLDNVARTTVLPCNRRKGKGEAMSDWTLGAVSARGYMLEAYCQTASCRKFFVFDLATLIDAVGADYLVVDIPEMDCEACGGRLEIKICISDSGNE